MDSAGPLSRRLRWHGQTDRGRVRKNNEDAFLALQFDAQEVRLLGKTGEDSVEHNDFAFAVSDGMGGANAGEFASRIAVDKITRLLPRAYKLAAAGLDGGAPDILHELVDQVHRALIFLGQSYEECAGMGTTLSLCWFTPEWMHFAHVGDSRIYYLPARGGRLVQLTEDDTHVGWLHRQGKLTEREARNHPRRTSLQKVLGAGHQFVEPQAGSVGHEPGDRFLLCTDGVIDGLFDSQILDLLTGPRPANDTRNPAQLLVDTAVQQSGRDNTTAMVIEVPLNAGS